MRKNIVWSALVFGVAALAFTTLDHADPSADRAPAAQISAPVDRVGQGAAAAGGAASSAGMHVAIEPESGDLVVASPQQRKSMDLELEDSLSRSADGLHEEFLPDGTVRVNLQGRFQNASIAVLDADGNVHTTCVENQEGAQNLFHGAPCEHAKLEEK